MMTSNAALTCCWPLAARVAPPESLLLLPLHSCLAFWRFPKPCSKDLGVSLDTTIRIEYLVSSCNFGYSSMSVLPSNFLTKQMTNE